MSSISQPPRRHLLPLAILVLAMAVSVIVRVRLLDAPLERDEGEHGYIAQTLLAGNAPWQLAYNLKLPGTDFMYALFMAAFGQTAVAIRSGLLLVNTATVLLIALLGKRLFGVAGGAIAGASYALLSCSQNVFGTIVHSTHFVVFFAVIATLLLLRSRNAAGWLFLSGVVYGIAFLMKQPGIAFAIFGALGVAWQVRESRAPLHEGVKRLAVFVAGVALPYAVLCLALWRAGTFSRFWFWTVTLARAYAVQQPLDIQFRYFEMNIPTAVGPNLFLWVLALLGLAAACWNPATRRAALFTSGLFVCSFVAVSAGGVFNPNYFILMLPALALANGAWIASGERAQSGGALVGTFLISCFALACFYSIAAQRAYLFRMTPYEFSRASYGLNPFPEAIKVAEYIHGHSDDRARIAVLGSEAEIYFYSHRKAATGYLFTYGLMETHQYATASQGEMIGEIEASRPEYMVYVGVPTSWLQRPGSSSSIFYWFADYASRNYEKIGLVDMLAGQPATYLWSPAAITAKPVSPAYIEVYRRIRQ